MQKLFIGTHLDNIDERSPYFGGDMVLSKSQLRGLKSGIIADEYRWPHGKVPYVLDSEFGMPPRYKPHSKYMLIILM